MATVAAFCPRCGHSPKESTPQFRQPSDPPPSPYTQPAPPRSAFQNINWAFVALFWLLGSILIFCPGLVLWVIPVIGHIIWFVMLISLWWLFPLIYILYTVSRGPR